MRNSEGQRGRKAQWWKGQNRWARGSERPPTPPQPASTPPHANAFEGYMARSDWSPSMTDRWRAEDDDRERHYRQRDRSNDRDRDRDWDRERPHIDRWARSPPRREIDSAFRGRPDLLDTDSYRPPQKRDLSRDLFYRRTPSPARYSRPQHHLPIARGRPLEDRISRPRDFSPDRAIKRRRTASPSPARSDRWVPEHRRPSPTRDYPDRRPAIDRAFSPRQSSPPRHPRPDPRDLPSEIDSYVPNPRRRDPTPPPSRRRERRSRSLRRSPSPPSRRPEKKPSKDPELSPYSARLLKTRAAEPEPAGPPTREPFRASVLNDNDRESMAGNYGNHGNRGNMMQHRPQRPYVDTRQQYGGSPPFGTPNGSQQGSPHSNSSYNNRGNWNANQGHHGPMNNSSPPNRQNSYPPQYHHNQQNYGPHHGHQPPYRGRGRGNYQQYPNERRFSGPDPPTQPGGNYRGRGGHYNNLQWSSGPKRGGSQGQNYHGSHPNSTHPSPHPSHDSNEPPREDESMFRPPRDLQAEDKNARPPPQAPSNQSNNPAKDSKFSFAFKSKPSQSTPTKAPPDLNLNSKAKPPPFRPAAENRAPPTHPRKQDFPDRDFSRPQDRRPPYNDRNQNQKSFPHDRKHPYPQDQGRRPRSRSPPPKKLKPEPRPRPKLPPDFAASESVYYRKPGNESVVGAGTYGKVFKAIHIYTRDQVALKKIRMEGERDGFPITAVREIRLLQHLRHKHVVALQEVMVEKNEAYMVFEYLSHDLTGLINHPTFKLTAAHKKDLARQMFEGLDFLHRRGVLHRDIKAANILVGSTGQLKYADFGLARFYTKSRQLDYTNRVITIWYRPPELLLGETQYGPSVDVWSAACVFMEMFTRKAVFPGEGGELSQLEKVYNVLGTPNRVEWPGIVDLPWYELMQPTQARKSRQFESLFKDVLSPAGMELMKTCFEYDPLKRPSAEDVLRHAYFASEEPRSKRAVELEDVKGDWHEFESKAHRKGEEQKRKAEWHREREKRKKAEKEAKEGGRKDSVDTNAKVEGESEPPPSASAPPEAEESDGEGSARMSMS